MPRPAASVAQYLHYWYDALNEEIGIRLDTDQRLDLLNILYAARQNAADPKLEALMIFQPLPETLFICKKSVELDP